MLHQICFRPCNILAATPTFTHMAIARLQKEGIVSIITLYQISLVDMRYYNC